jgi:BTB/POZ domain
MIPCIVLAGTTARKFDFAVHDLSFDIPPPTIISDFRSMVNNETFSDVTFIVEGRSVYAHKLMLTRCSYFEALFLGQMREAHMDTIRIEQVRYDIFLLVLEYLYTDQLLIGFNNAMELFEVGFLSRHADNIANRRGRLTSFPAIYPL